MPKKFTFQSADHIPFLNEGTFPLKSSHKNSTINLNFFLVGWNSKYYLLKLLECKIYQLIFACNKSPFFITFFSGG